MDPGVCYLKAPTLGVAGAFENMFENSRASSFGAALYCEYTHGRGRPAPNRLRAPCAHTEDFGECAIDALFVDAGMLVAWMEWVVEKYTFSWASELHQQMCG